MSFVQLKKEEKALLLVDRLDWSRFISSVPTSFSILGNLMNNARQLQRFQAIASLSVKGVEAFELAQTNMKKVHVNSVDRVRLQIKKATLALANGSIGNVKDELSKLPGIVEESKAHSEAICKKFQDVIKLIGEIQIGPNAPESDDDKNSLIKLREQWSNIIEFFKTMCHLNSLTLFKRVKVFNTYSNLALKTLESGMKVEGELRQIVLVGASEVVQAVFVVEKMSELYVQVSNDHLTEPIKVTGLLSNHGPDSHEHDEAKRKFEEAVKKLQEHFGQDVQQKLKVVREEVRRKFSFKEGLPQPDAPLTRFTMVNHTDFDACSDHLYA